MENRKEEKMQEQFIRNMRRESRKWKCGYIQKVISATVVLDSKIPGVLNEQHRKEICPKS